MKKDKHIFKKIVCVAMSLLTVILLTSCAKSGIEGLPPTSFQVKDEYLLGEELGFTPVSINYYYEHLTQKQKEIYVNMYNAVEDMYEGDVLLAEGVTKEDLTTATNAYFADNPHHFWIAESLEVCWTKTNNLGKFLKMIGNGFLSMLGIEEKKTDYTEYTDAYCEMSYIFKNKKERDAAKEQLYNAVRDVISQIDPEDSTFDKELYLHDWLADNCTYDDEAFNEFVETGSVGERISCHTAYGAIVNKTATCAGYARAMQILLSEVGVENRFVTGVRNDTSMGMSVAHAWNVVFIDGAPYHLDVTGDDKDKWGVVSGAYVEVKQDGKTYYNTGNRTEHRYFNITEEEISKDHSNFAPQYATSKKSNYYTVKQLSFYDPEVSVKKGIINELVDMQPKDNLYLEIYAGPSESEQQQYLNVLVNGEDGMIYECLKEANLRLGKKYYREDLVYYGLDTFSGIISVYTIPMETEE